MFFMQGIALIHTKCSYKNDLLEEIILSSIFLQKNLRTYYTPEQYVLLGRSSQSRYQDIILLTIYTIYHLVRQVYIGIQENLEVYSSSVCANYTLDGMHRVQNYCSTP